MSNVLNTLFAKKTSKELLVALVAANSVFLPNLSADRITVNANGLEIRAEDFAYYVALYNLVSTNSDVNPDQKKMFLERYKKAVNNISNTSFPEEHADEKVHEEAIKKTCDDMLSKERKFLDASVQRGVTHNEVSKGDIPHTFVLRNGKITENVSKKLLGDALFPFEIVFENIDGTLASNSAFKKNATSVKFYKSKLEVLPFCFENSEALETLVFSNSDVTLHYGSFTKLPKLRDFTWKEMILRMPFPFVDIFGIFDEKTIATKIYIGAITVDCLSEMRRRFGWSRQKEEEYMRENIAKKRTFCSNTVLENKELKEKIEECYKDRWEEKYEASKKENGMLRKINEELKTENRRLEGIRQNQRKEVTQIQNKNKKLGDLMETSEKNRKFLSDEVAKLKIDFENFGKEHTEAIGKLTKELEKSRSNFNFANEKLEKYKASYNAFKEEADALKQENEEQKEEIEKLKAFKSKWETKILTFERLEIEKNEFAKQLKTAKENENDAKRMLGKERAQNKEKTERKNMKISHLEQKLKETEELLFRTQTKVKELQNSETHILATMNGVLSDDEDEKEEEKSNMSRRVKKKIKTDRSKKNTGWKDFEWPKNGEE